MKLIIYHGKQGTGKTNQLLSAADTILHPGLETRMIVRERLIVTSHQLKYRFIDEFNFETDLNLIDPSECDTLNISTQNLPENYIEILHNRFGSAVEIFRVRETMFPICNYLSEFHGKIVADDLDGRRAVFQSRDEAIRILSSKVTPIEVGKTIEKTITVNLVAFSSAVVLMICHRFYYANKNNRLSTAWCLSGAKLFGTEHEDEIKKAEKSIAAKGKKSKRVYVSIVNP